MFLTLTITIKGFLATLEDQVRRLECSQVQVLLLETRMQAETTLTQWARPQRVVLVMFLMTTTQVVLLRQKQQALAVGILGDPRKQAPHHTAAQLRQYRWYRLHIL
jgi:hypothetical protein